MASKTVTRSTDRTIHEVYISFQISQRVFFFSASTIHAQWKKLSFPLNSSNDTLIVFLSCMCELISMAGSNFLDATCVQFTISNMTYLPLWRPPAVQEALDSENEFGYRIYEICTRFRGVLRAHNQLSSSHGFILLSKFYLCRKRWANP